MRELKLVPASDIQVKHAHHTGRVVFGNWTYNPSDPPSLDFADGEFYPKNWPYQVILDEVSTGMGLFHWLDHLSEKVWFSKNPENAGNFVIAVLDLCGDKFYGELYGSSSKAGA